MLHSYAMPLSLSHTVRRIRAEALKAALHQNAIHPKKVSWNHEWTRIILGKIFIIRTIEPESAQKIFVISFAILAKLMIRVNSCPFVVSKTEPKPTAEFRMLHCAMRTTIRCNYYNSYIGAEYHSRKHCIFYNHANQAKHTTKNPFPLLPMT